jgi:hypothetical protein
MANSYVVKNVEGVDFLCSNEELKVGDWYIAQRRPSLYKNSIPKLLQVKSIRGNIVDPERGADGSFPYAFELEDCMKVERILDN